MFDPETGNLTRTWIIFFEKLGLGSGSGSGADDCQFTIAVNGPIAVGDDVPPHKIINQPGTPAWAKIEAKIPPTGASIILDVILRPAAGGPDVSIFGDTKLVLPAGSTTIAVQTTFAEDIRFRVGDRLIGKVVQVGSTYPGSQISATIFWYVGA